MFSLCVCLGRWTPSRESPLLRKPSSAWQFVLLIPRGLPLSTEGCSVGDPTAVSRDGWGAAQRGLRSREGTWHGGPSQSPAPELWPALPASPPSHYRTERASCENFLSMKDWPSFSCGPAGDRTQARHPVSTLCDGERVHFTSDAVKSRAWHRPAPHPPPPPSSLYESQTGWNLRNLCH